MDEKIFCQSCGMPMTEEAHFATNADGSRNEDYCCYCYENGAFKQDCTMEEMDRLLRKNRAGYGDVSGFGAGARADACLVPHAQAVGEWGTSLRQFLCGAGHHLLWRRLFRLRLLSERLRLLLGMPLQGAPAECLAAVAPVSRCK